MKTNNYYIRSLFIALIATFGVSLFVLAEGEKSAPGGWYDDPVVSVAWKDYVTFSTVYNGKRYYLGVDTVAAKATPTPEYKIMAYNEPNYATMWIAGRLWSSTGGELTNKDYTRTIQSVWMEERVGQTLYLALGDPEVAGQPYNTLILSETGAMWHTAKDIYATGRYIQGYMYFYTEESGVDKYRYLTYDPLYEFDRLFEARPSESQRISVWDRKTGDDLVFKTNPTSYTFGLKTSADTTKIRFSSQVAYYPHVDRFRSRYARVDVYTSEPEVIDDQSDLLNPPYSMGGHYEWKSNPRGEGAYNGQSHMKMYTQVGTEMYDDDSDPETPDIEIPVMGWSDSTLLWVSDTKNQLIDNEWVDTIFVIGKSPFDRPSCRVLRKTGDGAPAEGDYLDHVDWLYVHLRINGKWYKDSIQLTRETFHVRYATTLTMDESPGGWEFPYFYDGKKADGTTPIGTEGTKDFDIKALYSVTVDTLHYNGAYETGGVLEEQTLDLTAQTPQEISSVKYNELIVNAYEPGTTTTCSWLTASTPDKKTVRLVANEYNPSATVDRIAEVHYTYRYLHSTQEGDWSEVTRIIWVSQLWKSSGVAGLYAFSHKPTAEELQEVYEKDYTIYAIPDQSLPLPLHRDHWGYYRWFIYEGDYKDRDLEHDDTWDFGLNAPTNVRNQNFMPINYATSAASRGRWDVIRDINAGNTEFEPAADKEHFEVGKRTKIPSVYYPKSITKNGKVACDVSAYYDIQTTGSSSPAYVKQNLTSLTEPTLSYRNVYNIRPAKEQADKLATYKGNGSGANWMEEHTVIVPAGREFSLQQLYPVQKGDASIDTVHLQYIYYANPTQTDAKIGTRDGLTDKQLEENDYYARIGKEKTIEEKYVLTLRTASELRGMTNGTSKTIILVNPRNNTGYILGKGARQIPVALPIPNGATTKAAFKDSLEKKLNDGGTYDSYFITIKQNKRSGDSYHNFLFGDFTLYNLYTSSAGEGEHRTQNIRWYDGWATGSEEFRIDAYPDGGSKADMPAGFSSGDLITIWTTRWGYTGYLASGQWSGGTFDYRIYRQSNNNTAYQAWLIYEVSKTTARTYNETPRWEKYNGSTSKWEEVERASDEDPDGYTMLADGSLAFDDNVHRAANETIQYRLRTEHFQLAKFTVVTRNPNSEGPRNDEAIISEEDIQSNYETLFTLGLENFPAPASDEVTAYYHKLPWNTTELSYHYPVGDEENQIPANRRVDGTSMLPMKGEYCFLNKFVDPTNPSHIISARDNYFLCIQAAEKPTTIFNFVYPGLTCSNQQVFLGFDLCNPVDNSYEPQITAELQGTKDGGSTWTAIYRFKTGEIKCNRDGNPTHDWWQTILPIDRKLVSDYDYFRCTASLTGTTESNAYILIDRMRFIERSRSFSVFQNKSTCIRDDSVYVQARIDYTADTALYKTGKLVAYQFQRWDNTANSGAGGYVPVLASKTTDGGVTYTQLTNETTPKAQIFPGYIKDAFTATESVTKTFLKSTMGNDYGYVLIPERTYNPDKSDDPSKTSTERGKLIDRALELLEITGDPAATRKAAFLNETGNVKTRDEVTSQSNIDFGTYSTPHIKSFVNEGTDLAPHWVIYLNTRLPISATDNRTFRIAMTIMNSVDDKPTFADESCATFRVINIKQAAELQVDGTTWTNHTRAEIEADDASGDALKLLEANETYRASIHLNLPSPLAGHAVLNTICKFDLMHAHDSVRDRTDDDANLAFERRYGCTRAEFSDAMETFRSNDPDNPIREQYDWRKVRPIDFAWSQADPTVLTPRARRKYDVINKLITDGVLELGLDYRDIYMGDKMDSYFYLMPVPASGWFTWDDAGPSGQDTLVHATICNDTIWLELHSKEPLAKLRFGYDSRVGDTYIVPVIRASKTDANEHLKVRISDITHTASSGAVIGWDSTYIVDSNDPDWLAGGISFRYHQDRIVQERIFDEYYKVPTSGTKEEKEADAHRYVIFRPVTSAYIDTLKMTDCPCYDYHANKTEYKTGTANDVMEQKAATGCNKWGVKPLLKGAAAHEGTAAHDMPGYQVANTADFRLKPGYWYKFKTAFFDVSSTINHDAGGDGTCLGHGYFIVAVAPDTVRWTPANLSGTNYWNDDLNWTPVMASKPSDGFKAIVPMADTKVIIPQVAEGQLPVVMDLVVDQKDTLEYGYKRNTCKEILFKPRSQMLGQERLEYEKAFVDVLFKTDNWQTFSPALKHVNSGDLYVPFNAATYNKANPATGASTDTVEFVPKSFPLGSVGGLAYNPRKYPFAFYQGFYNSTVRVAFNNTDEEDNPIAYTTQSSKNEVDWVKTNLIDTLYHPGHATVINSYDAYDVENREIVVCLPKPDNTYYSYGKNGGTYAAGHSYSMKNEDGGARTASDLTKNLAYDKTALTDAGGAGITYTLRNATESEFFFFGNPTMALVDVYQLCLDNADVLEHTGGTYKFTAYQLIDGTSNSYTVKEITAKGQYFIAPQRAVGLVANSTCKASKTLPVTLKPSALVAITGSGIIVSHEDVKDDAPVRRLVARHEDAQTPKRLYITAANETNRGIKKAHLTLGEQADASRGFVKGEDALSLSSGKHYYNSGAFSTPISLYTIADNEALMLDIRDTLNRVPVVFSTIDAKFDINNYTLLTFSMTGNWDKPLYLYDAVSNDSVLIRNGLQIAIETPLNDQIRYFINGSKRVTSEENQQGTATDIEEVDDQLPNTNYQSGTVIYDVLGRKIMTLNEYDLISNIHLPTGVYIIQRGSNTERMVIR